MSTTTNTSTAKAPAEVSERSQRGSGLSISLSGISCDRCPTARAKARIVMEAGEMYLCGHHFRENLDGLSQVAQFIVSDDPEGSYWMPEGLL